MSIKKIKFETPSRVEQETILNYDNSSQEWHIYSDTVKHCKRLKPLLDTSRPLTLGYNQHNSLTMVEGYLSNTSRIIFGKKPVLTPERIQKATKALKAYQTELKRNKQESENN